MPPEREGRRIIPLHGSAAPAPVPGEAPGPWNAERIVASAPPALRPLVVELLGAMGVPDVTMRELRRRLPETGDPEPTPEQMGAAVAILRGAVERAAREGADPDRTSERHACLDAASVAWAEAALARRARSQRELLRDVSHDIRSPLNSILFLADALRSGHSGDLAPAQKRQVDVLFMAAVTLVKLVNDLIDYAHLDDSSQIRVAETAFSPENVLDELRGLLGPLLDYHEVHLSIDPGESGPRRGDSRLLNRVLLNLVSNAIQAMPDGGGHVHLALASGPDGHLNIRVEDDGPGLDVAEVGAMLSAAAVGKSSATTEGWTHGLGLSITARLVAAAGGTLRVEANEPAGTRFLVSLPFAVV